jgi:hypothetical protein
MIPNGWRIYEVYLVSTFCLTSCSNDERSKKKQEDKLYFLKCLKRSHPGANVIEVKCKHCGCILHVDLVEGERSVARLIELNPFFKLCARFSRWFALHLLLWSSDCRSFLTYYVLIRLGELFFFATFLLTIPLLNYVVFWTLGYVKYFQAYSVFCVALLIMILYFSLHVLSELDYILGGLEIRATEGLKSYLPYVFYLFLRGRTFLVLYVAMGLIINGNDLLYGIMGEQAKVLLLSNICFTFMVLPLTTICFQVFLSLSVFLYALWHDYRRGCGSFKGDFMEISSLLNRLFALCAYVVIFFIGIYSVNTLAWHLSTKYELLSQIQLQFLLRLSWISTFWEFIILGVVVILPAVIFFPLLGGLTRNVKAEEMRLIKHRLLMALSYEEKSYLTSYMSQVMGSLKLASIIDYLIRVVFSAYLSLFIAKALAWL